MELLYFIFCSYGLTQILSKGKIFDKIRPKKYFFTCPMCVGFYVGILLWSLNTYTTLFTFDYNPITGLLLGGLSSCSSFLLCSLFTKDGFNFSLNLENVKLKKIGEHFQIIDERDIK